jgi:hypothetical protein
MTTSPALVGAKKNPFAILKNDRHHFLILYYFKPLAALLYYKPMRKAVFTTGFFGSIIQFHGLCITCI